MRCSAAIPLLALAVSAVAAPPRPSKIVIVIEENKGLSQVIGSPDAPYLNSLAAAGANFTSFFAITHPSQPNYIQFFSGASQGVTDNTAPAPGSPFSTPNLAAAIRSAGFSFTGYCEDLPAVGSTIAESGPYVRKHNPWVNWQNSPQGANQLPPSVNRPFTDFPTDFELLPDLSIVVPNLDNDMHDGTVAQGDAWLVANIKPFADWVMQNNGLLIITFDEDNSAERNRIPTVFYGPMIVPGAYTSTWTLHDLLRTLTDTYAVASPGIGASSSPIAGHFNTDPLVANLTFVDGSLGYAGTQDTYIESAAATTAHGSDTRIVCDGSPLSQGLIRFDSIVGAADTQIPLGATILAAKLMILTGPSSSSGDLSATESRLHRMLQPWSESSTWNSLVSGITANNIEAASTPEYSFTPNTVNTWAIFDVTDTVQAYASGAANHGWVIIPAGTDGWRAVSSENTASDRPRLEVLYSLGPACTADINHDGFVDAIDYDTFVNAFLGASYAADLNGDLFIDALDYDAFVTSFLAPC